MLAGDLVVAQERPSVRPRGFDFALIAGGALSFNGIRAFEADSITCFVRENECVGHDLGSGPMLDVSIQLPFARTIALSVGGAIGRLKRKRCVRGVECIISPEKVTAIKGNAAFLFRLKPQAPVFFGLGAGATHFDPGPVEGQEKLTEYGPLALIGYDFTLDADIGARITWWSYWMIPKEDIFDAAGTAYDALITFAVRIRFSRLFK